MIATVRDMYDFFLDGIKKERISTIPPAGFNRIINEAYEIWYRSKSIEIEKDQKRLDDLQGLRVVTDGVFQYNNVSLNPIPAINQENTSAYGRNLFLLPIPVINGNDVTINGIVYPEYRRLLNVMFKIRYYGDPCHDNASISDWKKGYVMRTNQRSEVISNPFRRPQKNRIYYEVIDNIIKMDVGESTNIGYQMRIEYIKYPKPIFYNSQNPSLSVMCELQSDQCMEIVEIAVKTYVERVSDPRYQTQMYEQVQRNIGK